MNKQIYNSKQWKITRARKLRSNPLCEDCESIGMITAANQVDHVKSIEDGGEPFDMDNLRSLCQRCHSRKTVYVDGGFGKQKQNYKVTAKGCDTSGIPIDPNHPWNTDGGHVES